MATKTPDPIILERFNLGGMAHSKWSGIKNALYKMVGWDPHSAPGVLRVAQKLSKISGITVTEFCLVSVNCSNGSQYWFSSDSGKIWEYTSAGVIRLVHTTVASAGQHKCLGAAEYQGYIYWFTQNKIHRIEVAKADDNNWVADAVQNWATFTNGDLEFHPAIEQNLVLFIGDGNVVAQIDAGTFSANAVDVKSPLRVKCLGTISTDLLIGAYVAGTVTETVIVRWNTWSTSFTTIDSVPEVGINAFLPGDNNVFVSAGIAGNIYVYDGEKLELYKKIPGDYSPTQYGTVNPYSVANMAGQILFGFSNGSGNPADQGVYRLARHSRDYPWILDFPYPISERSAGEFLLSGLQIGSILSVGFDLYVAWKRNTTVTVTIASPGVVTFTAHGLTNGDAISFSTTGALPTGITAGTTYYVRSTGTDTLNLYDTSAHAVAGGSTGLVATSGTQSGVHTAATVGIDKLDWSNKLDGAYLESRVSVSSRESLNNISSIVIPYASLPANTDLNMYLSKNYASYGSALSKKTDTQRNIMYADSEAGEFSTIQLKIKATTSSNNAPEIESAAILLR